MAAPGDMEYHAEEGQLLPPARRAGAGPRQGVFSAGRGLAVAGAAFAAGAVLALAIAGRSRAATPADAAAVLSAAEVHAAAAVHPVSDKTRKEFVDEPATKDEQPKHDSPAKADVKPVPAAGKKATAAEAPKDAGDVVEDGRTGEKVAEAEEKKNDGCAAPGASCLQSQCCQSPGHQCYTKDAWWGQCMASCTPGPNVVDQSSPSPWECKALGPRTPGEASTCSAEGEDCSKTQCCSAPGTQCYRKNKYWATCRAECTPGPNPFEDDPQPWSCEALGPRTPAAAPWVKTSCAKGGDKCTDKGCCAEPGHQCYTQSPWYAKCRPSCTAGQKDNSWEPAWECKEVGMRTPDRFEGDPAPKGVVKKWVVDKCSGAGENCLETQCCHAVNHQCFTKNDYWGSCREDCSTDPDPNDGNFSWACKALGPRSWGLAIKGYPSLYCFSLYMPEGYEGPLLQSHLKANAGIFACDGYDVFANSPSTLGKSADGIEVSAILIPKIAVGVSQDGTAGNAKLFMAVWDKVIAGNRFRDYDFTLKVDPDAVLIAWRIRDHMRPHIGSNAYVVNCNKFPNSPNFPMMFGAVEIFSMQAMIAYAMGSWRCGQQLPWGSWGEDYYMTHCLDFLGVGRIADFGVLGDNVCTGANCADQWTGSFHPFKDVGSWMQCWGQATKPGR